MKTCIITGCGRGLGKSLKEQLEARGYKVLGATRAEMDVRDPYSINKFTLAVMREHKTLDLLINNAAVLGGTQNILLATDSAFLDAMAVNAHGALMVIRSFWSMLKACQGLVVNVSSTDAMCHDHCRAAYAVSKAALEAISKKLAIEGRQCGVGVEIVRPAWFSSDMGGPQAPMTPDEAARDILDQVL